MERSKRIQMFCVSKRKRATVDGAKVHGHQEEEEEMVFKIKEENLLRVLAPTSVASVVQFQ